MANSPNDFWKQIINGADNIEDSPAQQEANLDALVDAMTGGLVTDPANLPNVEGEIRQASFYDAYDLYNWLLGGGMLSDVDNPTGVSWTRAVKYTDEVGDIYYRVFVQVSSEEA